MKDGGAAFPCVADGPNGGWLQEGMSLRDWFAGWAMSLLNEQDDDEILAKAAYEIADAMLTEREKTNG